MTTSSETPGSDAPPLESLLAQAIDELEESGESGVKALLEQHPEHADRIRSYLSSLRELGMVQEQTPDPESLERLGDFRILRRLAQGGMGVVYLARQLSVDRVVALKVIRPDQGLHAQARERFRRESQVIARLGHPATVRVHAAGEEQGVLYYAMEFVPGRNLEEVIAREDPPPVRRAVRWLGDIAEALHEAHEAGLVHRDVKPANIRITPEDQAKLLDFGLAREVTGASLTQTGRFHGSPQYAPPEQVRGAWSEVGPRSDVYSLGVTLYQCVCRRLPFSGRTIEEVFQRVLRGAYEPVRTARPDLPRELGAIITRAMELQPEDRYASAADFAGDLRAFLEYRPVRARPPGPVRRTVHWTRRHPLAALTALLGSLAILLALGAVLVERRGARRAREISAEEALHRAEGRFARYVASRGPIAELERTLGQRSQQQYQAYASPDAWTELDRDLQILQRMHRERDADLDAMLRELAEAERLAPALAAVDELRLRLNVEQWRAARLAGDATAADFYRARIEALDPEGRITGALQRGAELTITSEPPGARVHLFRYELQSELFEGGSPRLVPVPASGAPPGVAPGTWALEVTRPAGDFLPGDGIVELFGHPIEGSVLVIEGGGPLERGDRIVEVDGHPITRLAEFLLWTGSLAETPRHALVVDRYGDRIPIADVDLDELGAWIVDPLEAARAGGVDAVVARGTTTFETTLPPDLALRPTACPLLAAEHSVVGTTPLAERRIVEGSYLALLTLPGYESARLPFDADLDATTRWHVPLWPAEEALDGFVRIVPRDPQAPCWWIQQHEVTAMDYVEFLNDPPTLQRIRSADQPLFYPRAPETPDSYLPVDSNGRFYLPPHFTRRTPVSGLSGEDATAYARWRTERARASGQPWVFALPSVDEVNQVRQVSRFRTYIHGPTYRPHWIQSQYSTPMQILEPAMSYPIDESPHGVHDLAGSVVEWTRTPGNYDATYRHLTGGNFGLYFPHAFRTDFGYETKASHVGGALGLRLVAYREGSGAEQDGEASARAR